MPSEQSSLLNQVTTPFYESFYITEISPTSHKRLTQTIDCAKKNIFIVNIICGPRTRAPPRLLDEANKRKGTLCTEHCPLCEGETGGIFFFPEQARSQLALCCLPVTRVGPPQAKAPTKILRGADGLKTWLLPPSHTWSDEHSTHTLTHTHTLRHTRYKHKHGDMPISVTQSVQGSAESAGINERFRLDFKVIEEIKVLLASSCSRYFEVYQQIYLFLTYNKCSILVFCGLFDLFCASVFIPAL